eukprot:5080045-Amphidinium_carterae.1
MTFEAEVDGSIGTALSCQCGASCLHCRGRVLAYPVEAEQPCTQLNATPMDQIHQTVISSPEEEKHTDTPFLELLCNGSLQIPNRDQHNLLRASEEMKYLYPGDFQHDLVPGASARHPQCREQSQSKGSPGELARVMYTSTMRSAAACIRLESIHCMREPGCNSTLPLLSCCILRAISNIAMTLLIGTVVGQHNARMRGDNTTAFQRVEHIAAKALA